MCEGSKWVRGGGVGGVYYIRTSLGASEHTVILYAKLVLLEEARPGWVLGPCTVRCRGQGWFRVCVCVCVCLFVYRRPAVGMYVTHELLRAYVTLT